MSRYYQSVMGTPQPLYVGAPLEMDLLKQKKVDAASQEIGSELAYIPEQFKKANALSEMLVYDKTIPVDDKAKISAKLNDINGRMKEIGDQVQQGNINPMEIVGKIRGLRHETDQYFSSQGEGGKYQQMYDVYQKQQKALAEDKDIQNNQYLGNSVYGNRMDYRQGQSLLSEQPIAKYVDQTKEVNEALTGIKMQVFAGSGSARDNAGYINKWIKEGTYDAKILGSLFGSNWQAVMQGDLSKIGGALANSSTIKQLEQKQIMMQRQGYKPEEIYGSIMKEVRGLGDYAKEKFREDHLETGINTDEGYWKQQQWGREDQERYRQKNLLSTYDDVQIGNILKKKAVPDNYFDNTGKLVYNTGTLNTAYNPYSGAHTSISGKNDNMGNNVSEVKTYIDTFRRNNPFAGKNLTDKQIYNGYMDYQKEHATIANKEWYTTEPQAQEYWNTMLKNKVLTTMDKATTTLEGNETGTLEQALAKYNLTKADWEKQITDGKAKVVSWRFNDPSNKDAADKTGRGTTIKVQVVDKNGDGQARYIYLSAPHQIQAIGKQFTDVMDTRSQTVNEGKPIETSEYKADDSNTTFKYLSTSVVDNTGKVDVYTYKVFKEKGKEYPYVIDAFGHEVAIDKNKPEDQIKDIMKPEKDVHPEDIDNIEYNTTEQFKKIWNLPNKTVDLYPKQ